MNQNFTFTGNDASKLKQGNREQTSVNSKKSAADIWSEKDVGFIGPITFLSDLTVGPTNFAKSEKVRYSSVHAVYILCLCPLSKMLYTCTKLFKGSLTLKSIVSTCGYLSSQINTIGIACIVIFNFFL